jgi:hypothetical protein
MPGAKVRFQTGGESGVLHALVQLKETRMRCADADPDYFWPAFGRKGSDAADREKKRRDLNLGERLAQLPFSLASNFAEKTESQMHLLGSEPAHAAQIRIERRQRISNGIRQINADEKALGSRHLSLVTFLNCACD